MEQGREAPGRHGKRRLREGFARSVIAARTVERGKNPEDGTGGGLATLTHQSGGSAAALATRGTRRRRVRGRKNPRRGGSRAHENASAHSPYGLWGEAEKERGRHRRERTLKRNPTPREALRNLRPGVRLDEKTPEAVETAWGARPKPIRRYSPCTTNL
jgi:hypothetical protein